MGARESESPGEIPEGCPGGLGRKALRRVRSCETGRRVPAGKGPLHLAVRPRSSPGPVAETGALLRWDEGESEETDV